MVNPAAIQEVRERAATVNPYHWAAAYRRMKDSSRYEIFYRGNRYMPYLWEPYSAWNMTDGKPPRKGTRIVVSKCGQSGWTESAINLAFWFMSTLKEGVLYGLPSEDQIKSFALARVNPSIKNSPVLQDAFKDTDSAALKIGWGESWYFRGAISKSKLREIPVGLVIRDEFGEMDEKGREKMLSRQGASAYKYVYDLGNPEFPESGIDLAFKMGDQRVWKVKCEHCGAIDEPLWPESVSKLEIDSTSIDTERASFAEGGDSDLPALICLECGKPIDKFSGSWVVTNPGAPHRSYRMSHFISPSVEPWEMVLSHHAARGNPTKMQEFYNTILGLPYAPEGARITDEAISGLPRLGEMVLGSKDPTVMGVDIGAENHVIVRRMAGGILWAGTLRWDELPHAMSRFSVDVCGMDIRPETTKAKEFAAMFPGKVILVQYNPSPTSTGKDDTPICSKKTDGVVPIWTVARTEAMDQAVALILNGEEAVPTNPPADLFRHWKAITRKIVKSGGKEYATWDEEGKPDHFAHAFLYSELVRDDMTPIERAGIFL